MRHIEVLICCCDDNVSSTFILLSIMFFSHTSLNFGCPGLQGDTVHMPDCKPRTCELAGDPQTHRTQTLSQPTVTIR